MKGTRWWNRPRFDALEASLLGLVFVALGLFAGALAYGAGQEKIVRQFMEFRTPWLVDRYGPDHSSQGQEEWIIRDFFGERRGGFFVDIGANDYRALSTTYYLDVHMGWSGIAVDAQPQFEAGYRTHRPRTKFFAFFVSDGSDSTTQLFVGENPAAASSDRDYVEGNRLARVMTVPTITLTDLLTRERVTHLDFLSIDVDFAEMKVLAGFDVERFRPGLVCVEAHPPVRQPILDYFAAHRYVIVGKYLGADPVNLYFMPSLADR